MLCLREVKIERRRNPQIHDVVVAGGPANAPLEPFSGNRGTLVMWDVTNAPRFLRHRSSGTLVMWVTEADGALVGCR